MVLIVFCLATLLERHRHRLMAFRLAQSSLPSCYGSFYGIRSQHDNNFLMDCFLCFFFDYGHQSNGSSSSVHMITHLSDELFHADQSA